MWLKHKRFSVTKPDPISIVKQNSVKTSSDSMSHIRLKQFSSFFSDKVPSKHWLYTAWEGFYTSFCD